MEWQIPQEALTQAGAWSDKSGLRDVKEEHECTACKAQEGGQVPSWLKGSLYRQSGGAFHGEDKAALDGIAHVTAFHFGRESSGSVSFSNKYMRTDHFQRFIDSGARMWQGTAATVLKEGYLARALRWMRSQLGYAPPALYSGVNPNVTLWSLGGERMAATTEVNNVCEFDPITLRTIGEVVPLAQEGGANVIFTPAHWFQTLASSEGKSNKNGFHVDLELNYKITLKGPIFTFTYGIYHGNTLPKKKVAQHELCTFAWADRDKQPAEKRAAYMHTVAQSQNYFVVIESSWRMRYESLLANDLSNGFFGLFDKLDDAPINFIVYKIVDQAKGIVEKIGSMPCKDPKIRGMIWHVGNCFETVSSTSGEVEILVDCSFAANQKSDNDSDRDEPTDIRRFTLNLGSMAVTTSALAAGKRGQQASAPPDATYEFLNINPRFHFRENSFIYAVKNAMFRENSQVVRINAASGQVRELEGLLPGEMPTEPIFAPRPGAKEDDELDGVVIVEAIDGAEAKSHLLIVDPKEFKVVARLQSPVPANFGLHSIWKDHSDDTLTVKY